MKVFMVRHGATRGNIEKRYVGSTDEPLLPEAVAALQNKREYFRELIDSNSEIKLFASPMKRCLETADILFPDLKPHIVNGFRECDFGAFEYKNYRELNGNADYQRFIDSGGITGFPGGETRQKFVSRCETAFRSILPGLNIDDSLVLVVHGGTIMALLDTFSSPHRDYYDWQCGNGEGYVAELGKDEQGRMVFTDVEKI